MISFFRFFSLLVPCLFYCSFLHATDPQAIKVTLSKITERKILFTHKKDYSNSSIEAPFLYNNTIVFRTTTPNAIYSNLYEGIQPIANTSTSVPNAKRNDLRKFNKEFSTSYENIPTLSSNGDKIVFLAQDRYSDNAIYSFTNKTLSIIADKNTSAPTGKKEFSDFADPGFVNGNNIAFSAQTSSGTGIYAIDSKGKISTLLDPNATIPEGDGHFTSIDNLVFSKGGDSPDFVFLGTGNNGQRGLYLSKSGHLKMILNELTLIPDGTGHFQTVIDLSFDAATGKIAFIVNGLMGQQGIYLYNGKTIIKVVTKQTVMPDIEAKFNSFSGLSLDHDVLVFTAADYGEKHKGVYLYNSSDIFKLLSSSDSIDKKKPSIFKINHFSLNKNKLGLVIDFGDESSSVYIASFENR